VLVAAGDRGCLFDLDRVVALAVLCDDDGLFCEALVDERLSCASVLSLCLLVLSLPEDLFDCLPVVPIRIRCVVPIIAVRGRH